jgi:hypothetical protein
MRHDRNAPCLPPAQYQRILGMHWLQMFDFSGHPMGHVALQWNPGSRTWTHSNAHDTHGSRNGLETKGFKWVGYIPLPPLSDDDVDPARKLNSDTLREAIIGGTTVDDMGNLQVGNAVTAVMALIKPHLRDV